MQHRRIRFVEPMTRPGRPFNAFIRRWPLMGPITLASLLERGGYDVAVYNENISGSLLDNAAALADVAAADVVGISIMTPTARRGYLLAERLRQSKPRPLIVFGGVHATFCPEEARAHGDLVVCGEGESVIDAIAGGELRSGIVHGPPVEDLDALPPLNHTLMRDFERLLNDDRRRDLYELPIVASRGCPYNCQYCTVTRMFGRRVRRQSVDKVLADIRHHVGHGFRRFFFYDDNFTSDREWARQLCARLAPLGVQFNAQTRADFHWLDASRRRCDDALLSSMEAAGGRILYIGYETVDDDTARAWHKGYRGRGPLDQRLLEDSRILHAHGFWIHGMFVMGPQHTAQTASQIIAFARRSRLETLQISILTPFPGTPLMEEMRPHLLLNRFPEDWDYYDGTHCVYSHARLGVAALQATVLNAHRRFYGWGGWSLRRLQALTRQQASLWQKLRDIWENAQMARATLKSWKREMAAYLETVRARAPQWAGQALVLE